MESDVKDEKSACSWRVDEEHEERYNFTDEKGLWEPKPEDILSMFDKLSKGGALPLEWTCPGRRAPETEQDAKKKEETSMEVDEDEAKEEKTKEPEPCAFDFDFDSQADSNIKAPPMRTLGGPGRTPRTEKRVARMDNIMDSLLKQQMQRNAEREARKAKASPGRNSQARGRVLKFGSPIAQNHSPLAHNQNQKNPESSQLKATLPAPVTAIGMAVPANSASIDTVPQTSAVSTSFHLPVQPSTLVSTLALSSASDTTPSSSNINDELLSKQVPEKPSSDPITDAKAIVTSSADCVNEASSPALLYPVTSQSVSSESSPSIFASEPKTVAAAVATSATNEDQKTINTISTPSLTAPIPSVPLPTKPSTNASPSSSSSSLSFISASSSHSPQAAPNTSIHTTTISELPTPSSSSNPISVFPPQTTSSSNPISVFPPQTTSSSNPISVFPPQTTPSSNPISVFPPQTTSSSNPISVFPPQTTSSSNPISVFPTQTISSSNPISVFPPQTTSTSISSHSQPEKTLSANLTSEAMSSTSADVKQSTNVVTSLASLATSPPAVPESSITSTQPASVQGVDGLSHKEVT